MDRTIPMSESGIAYVAPTVLFRLFQRPVKHKFQKISRASSRPAGQATLDDDRSQWKGATNNRDKAGETLAAH